MAQKLYKVFLVKMSEAWYQLSPEEQERLITKVDGALDQVGARRVILCSSGWSSGEWPVFGVEEFPDTDAMIRHNQILAEFNWDRYVDSMTVVGTEWPSS